jgi:hypothetical protein
VSERSLESTRTQLLFFSKNHSLCRQYRRWVGSIVMASLTSFSQGLGSTDPGSELPICLYCWVSAETLGSSDPVSEVPRILVSTQ